MPISRAKTGLFLLLAMGSAQAGCSADKFEVPFDEGDDDLAQGTPLPVRESGPWNLSATARSAGEAQSGDYEDAGAWRGGRGCAGELMPGTHELGEWLVANFPGLDHFEGYACRPNTADTSRLSMHGTGRALDLFVPLDGGEADNGIGDSPANWLVEHATEIGVQFIIWDRTKWNVSYSGRKDRAYTGPHPHHDHLHIELTTAGATRATEWFADTATRPPATPAAPAPSEPTVPGDDTDPPAPTPPGDDTAPPAPAPPPPPAPDCGAAASICDDTCEWAGDGECDDGGEGSDYSVCAFGSDCEDCGARVAPGTDPSCDPSPTPDPTPTPAPDPPPPPTGGEVTPESVLAALGSCSPLAGVSRFSNDSGGSSTVSICQRDDILWFTSDLDVDCDGGRGDECMSDPYYMAETSGSDSSGRPLDASTLPFIVLPLSSNGFDYRDHGIAIGQVALVIFGGRMQYGIFADAGPRGVIGEASYAMAESLGIDPDPSSGGTDSGVTFVVFTGSGNRVAHNESHAEAESLGSGLALALVEGR